MDLNNEKIVDAGQISDAGNAGSGTPEPIDAGKPDPKNLRSLVRGAISEQKQVEAKRDPSPARQAAAQQRAREEQTGKFVPGATTDSKPKAGVPEGRSPQVVQGSPAASNDGTAPAAGSQTPAAVAAPAALSKELKAIWDTLPVPVQAEFAKREADTQKGVEQLKARYQPVEEALAPVRHLLQQRGMNDGQAVKQLFDWHLSLNSPNKSVQTQAFRALAQASGFDLATLVPPSGTAQPNPQSQTEEQPDFRQFLEPVRGEVQAVKADLDRIKAERVTSEISSFSRDKPHFEKVRVLMGQLMGTGAATSLEDAYAKACRAHPEVFETIQQEAEAKRQADAQAAAAEQQRKAAEAETERKRQEAEQVAKARKAGVGPRAGSPAGGVMQIAKSQHGKPVRDSIRDAIKDRSASI